MFPKMHRTVVNVCAPRTERFIVTIDVNLSRESDKGSFEAKLIL